MGTLFFKDRKLNKKKIKKDFNENVPILGCNYQSSKKNTTLMYNY